MELLDLKGQRNYDESRIDLIQNSTKHTDDFEKSTLTRHSCVAALCLSWVIALACTFGGAALLSRAAANNNLGWLPIAISIRAKQLVPLALNIIVTGLTEGLGLIHATTLRWALKNRLVFNSNLRLFSTAGEYWAFGRVSNFFNAGFLALLYCGTSIVFADVPAPWISDKLSDSMQSAVGFNPDSGARSYISPSAILALGIGLLGKAAISTWQLVSVSVPTWSTSPIETAWACTVIGQRTRVEGRCLMSVHESKQKSGPRRPRRYQSFAWSANSEIRRVVIYLWVLVALGFVFFGAILGLVKKLSAPCKHYGSAYICGAYEGSSWNLLPDTDGITSLLQIQTISTIRGGAPKTVNDVATGMFVTVIFLMAVQSVITMGLHCAELLVNSSRDEYIWRSTYTETGYKPDNAIVTVLKSPKSLFLLALKPIVHWLYGLSLTYYFSWGVFIRPPQILYLSLSLMILAVFGTVLCFSKPSGPQPATFGHIQTLVDLIDEYGHNLYWGEKFVQEEGLAHAGTATLPLSKITRELYVGEEAETGACGKMGVIDRRSTRQL